jgi:diguanylate cyclase (GGDEF)-like protein/PAS domain S-box-containing protein
MTAMPVNSFRQQVTLWLVAALGLLWSAVAWDTSRTEELALEHARRETAAWASTFASQAESTFLYVDHALIVLRQTWLSRPSEMGDGFLLHKNALADAIVQVAVIDTKGYLVYSNLGMPKEPTFLGDREHFTVHQAQLQDQLFISRPVKGRVSGKWTIQLTRPMFQQGQFAGVIVVSLDPNHFVRFYHQTGFGMDGAARMVRDSGEIMARSSEQDKYVGTVINPTPYADPGAPLQGNFRRAAQADGVERLSSYSRLPQYGLTVIIGPSIEETLAPVRSQQIRAVLSGLMVSLLLALVVWQLLRNAARQNAALQAQAESRVQLQASHDLLEKLSKHVPGAFFQFQQFADGHSRFPYASQGLIEVGGVAPEQVREDAAPLFANVHPNDYAALTGSITSAAQELQSWEHEYRANLPQRGLRFLRGHARPEKLADGSTLWHGFISDITERKLAEHKLQLAASVFTHAREGIMITDAQGTIVDVNETFTRITGYSRAEAVGQNPRILNSGRQPSEYYAAMWRALQQNGQWSGEVWNRRKSGEVYAEMQTVSAVRDAQGQTRNYVALFSDITPMKEHQQQLERMAHYDALTHLPNRVLLADRLHQAIRQCERRRNSLAVVFLDLDGFKSVNDNHGHAIGDSLLIALSQRMKSALREGDTLSRMGGDEFVAILVDLDDALDCDPVLERLLLAASAAVEVGDSMLQVSASMGVTIYPQDGSDADLLMRHADQAMYVAKQAGKNRYHLFDVQHEAAVKTRRDSVERVRRALDRNEFVLYYQPKVDIRRGIVVGAEALIRWQHPERGVLAPSEFLPFVEEHPVSVAIGEWVLDTALGQMEAWQSAGLPLPVSVNIGALQLQQEGFADHLAASLRAHPEVAPHQLELEILETSAMQDIAEASRTMQQCRALGVRFALDDFGTGYSSLTYLKHLPAEMIKIDQSFVRDMLGDVDDLAIVRGVIGLAAAFGREVIAEGVETDAHCAQLLALGCDLAQGYGIARPMPAADLPQWVTQWTQGGGSRQTRAIP